MYNLITIIFFSSEIILTLLWVVDPEGNYKIIMGVIAVLYAPYRYYHKNKAKVAGADSSKEFKVITKKILKSNPKTDWEINRDQLKTIAIFNKDVKLRLEINEDDDGIQNDNFIEPWANMHADSKAVGLWCKVYYGSTLMQRVLLVSIDGHRALLAPPKLTTNLKYPNKIPAYNYKLAKILDTSNTLNDYIVRSGLSVEGGVIT